MYNNKKSHLYEYLDFVKMAKLDCKSKALLYFYATSYNWTQNQPSWYSQRSICALVSMAPSTYHSVQKKLESLGWIKTNYRGRDKTVQVWVSVGNPDPEYDEFSWSPWHPFNIEDEEGAHFDHDPFEHRERQLEPLQSSYKGSRKLRQAVQESFEAPQDQAANEAYWTAFEDPRSSLSDWPILDRKTSQAEFNDLATELWGV